VDALGEDTLIARAATILRAQARRDEDAGDGKVLKLGG
jgi:hypothetical protein